MANVGLLSGRSAYGQRHRRLRGLLLGEGVKCAHCKRNQATELDHDPPLSMHVHREGSGCCRLIPACHDCQRTQGTQVRQGTWRPDGALVDAESEEERGGLERDDGRWDVPWLA